ncbi:hypothetical protein FXF51_05680 [Nonomuraea sp. PA05]|uniref:hypothetical protein n=1 Tax=Nonomuraea sp. PA05 TaxID=2604466 RepID=UPI0011D3DE49|nr:hypothetical protein [Nonomuraea sp. PA05]TYB69650.1 hypothetical protein FXF51_05680 [Nonomuraea sp. PA05]
MNRNPQDYGTFEVRRTLTRPDGSADVVVAYIKPGKRGRTYSSYRHQAGGAWLSLNESWTDLERAVAETPGLQQGEPLHTPELLRLLTAALASPAGVTS